MPRVINPPFPESRRARSVEATTAYGGRNCRGLAHFWFVTIHPLEDGNGRVARAIADTCLARADGVKERIYSMSAQIEAERKDYYAALEQAQRGGLNVSDCLSWFLSCLGRAIVASNGRLASVLRKAKIWESLGAVGVNEGSVCQPAHIVFQLAPCLAGERPAIPLHRDGADACSASLG